MLPTLRTDAAGEMVIDATGRPADYDDERVFADPHPVAAVEELKRDGRVSSTPQTKLVDVPIPDPA